MVRDFGNPLVSLWADSYNTVTFPFGEVHRYKSSTQQHDLVLRTRVVTVNKVACDTLEDML